MTIGRMEWGKKPVVQAHDGAVAIWAGQDGDETGLIISPLAAVQTALAILGLAATLVEDGGVHLDTSEVEVEENTDPEEDCVARIVVTVSGCKVGIPLSAQLLVEVAAHLSALARKLG